MDNGLNIATRYGQVGIALALANTPDRAAKILQRYTAQCISCDTSPNQLAENLGQRSEEHTSELQSRSELVCRLLL